MRRCQKNEGERFSATVDANAKETEASLRLRRKEMARAWDDLDEGWKDLEQRMAEAGIVKSSASDEGIAWLNVGGSQVNVHHSAFKGKKGSSASWTLADLFAGTWDKRLPRDSEGRTVLDESPACVKYLVHTLLKSPGAKLASPVLVPGLPAHELPYLPHAGRALGLSETLPPTRMVVSGGSTVLGADDEHDQVIATLQGWCPGTPKGLQLLHRASRDDWSAAAFHKVCRNDTPSTITLLLVDSPGASSAASVVGGFSSTPWTSPEHNLIRYYPSPGSFVFMLRDGCGSGPSTFQPAKWGSSQGLEAKAIGCCRDWGPTFGEGPDLHVNSGFLMACNISYDVPAESPFLKLHGRDVVDMEVFRVFDEPLAPQPAAKRAKTGGVGITEAVVRDITAVSAQEDDDDVSSFGKSVGGALMEERVALHRAQTELSQANVRFMASANALAAVYGPDVSEGKGETVVELSVHGTRMTTLLSTLQACPDSAFAARFDEGKWPIADKEVDEHGRRMINDCSPSVFSKVLDILRMKKRAAWADRESQQGRSGAIRVAVKATDRKPFDEFVHMYFPGGVQGLTVDYLDSSSESKANA